MEDFNELTDTDRVGKVVSEIKEHIDKRFDALEKREKDWGKKLHRLLAWLASQFAE